MASKRSLNVHFRTCKIKNGGMHTLFAEVNRLSTAVQALKDENKQLQEANKSINITGDHNKIYSSHHNTENNFNFQIVNYGSPEQVVAITKIVATEIPALLALEPRRDLSRHKQIQERLQQIVGKIYRNPEHPELQCVYVTDPKQSDDNSYKYEDGWVIQDWKKLGQDILRRVYDYVKTARIRSDEDKLGVTKHIFNLAGFGELDKSWTKKRVIILFEKLGHQLGWESIISEYEGDTAEQTRTQI
jgi:hypothetical protein